MPSHFTVSCFGLIRFFHGQVMAYGRLESQCHFWFSKPPFQQVGVHASRAAAFTSFLDSSRTKPHSFFNAPIVHAKGLGGLLCHLEVGVVTRDFLSSLSADPIEGLLTTLSQTLVPVGSSMWSPQTFVCGSSTPSTTGGGRCLSFAGSSLLSSSLKIGML